MDEMKRVERLDRVVPLSPEEVIARLEQAVPTGLPLPGRPTYRLRADTGGFTLRRWPSRNALRPTLHATLEPVPGGTRVVGEAALPTWARPAGRAVTGVAVLLALVAAAAAFLGAGPEGVGAELDAAMVFAALWMPIVAILVPGLLVSQAWRQRGQLVAEVERALPEAPPVDAPALQQDAQRRARAAAPKLST